MANKTINNKQATLTFQLKMVSYRAKGSKMYAVTLSCKV